MITAAEIFGALNRLAVATIIRDFQTGPSGFGATTDAGQASQPGAATPAQGEILAPVAPSPNPSANPSESPAPELVLMKPAPAAGETLLGMRAPLPPTHANDAPSPASAQRGAPMTPYFGAGSRAVSPPSTRNAAPDLAIRANATDAPPGQVGLSASPTDGAQKAPPERTPQASGPSPADAPAMTNEAAGSVAPQSAPAAAAAAAGQKTAPDIFIQVVGAPTAPLNPVGGPATHEAAGSVTNAPAVSLENSSKGNDIGNVAPPDFSTSVTVEYDVPNAALAAAASAAPIGAAPGSAFVSLPDPMQGVANPQSVETLDPNSAPSVQAGIAAASFPTIAPQAAARGITPAASQGARLNLRGEVVAPNAAAPMLVDARASPRIASFVEGQNILFLADRSGQFLERVALGGISDMGAAALQTERAGVIASFILNAAMIPGWPLQRPFEPRVGEEIEIDLPLLQGMDDEELVEYLAAIGANEGLSARIRAASNDPVRYRKLLRGLAVLVAIVTTIFVSMRSEIEEVMDDLREELALGETFAPRGRRRLRLE